MSPSFVATAIYLLGQCGYTPQQVKFQVPRYEINQILHAHLVANGVVLEWAHYEPDEELSVAFEEMKVKAMERLKQQELI